MKRNIRIAPGQPTPVDIHVIHLPGGVKTPLSVKLWLVENPGTAASRRMAADLRGQKWA